MKLLSSFIITLIPKYRYSTKMFATTDKIIENYEFPECRSCKYFEPRTIDSEFAGLFSKCTKFGNKDRITGEIDYNYADLNRNNENKCGIKGRYYEREPHLEWKILKHRITNSKMRTYYLIGIILSLQIMYYLVIKENK